MEPVLGHTGETPGGVSSFNTDVATNYGALGSSLQAEPPDAMIFRPSANSRLTTIASAKWVKIYPRNGGPFGPGGLVTIDIPRTDWMDTAATSLVVAVTLFSRPGVRYTESDLPRYKPNVGATCTTRTQYGLRDGTHAPHYQSTDVTENGFLRLKNDASRVFSRWRLLVNGAEIENIEDSDILCQILNGIMLPVPMMEEQTLLIQGLGDLSNPQHRMYRNYQASQEMRWYVLNIPFGIFAREKILPLGMMPQITMEMYVNTDGGALLSSWEAGPNVPLANSGAALENGTVAEGSRTSVDNDTASHGAFSGLATYPYATFQLTQVFLWMRSCTATPSYTQQMAAKMSGQGLLVHFKTWKREARQVVGSSTESFFLSARFASIAKIYAVFQTGNSLRNIGVDQDFPGFGVHKLQWRVGGVLHPPEPLEVDGGAAMYTWWMLRQQGILGDMLHHGQQNWINANPTPAYNANIPRMQTRLASSGWLPRGATPAHSVDYTLMWHNSDGGIVTDNVTKTIATEYGEHMWGNHPAHASNFAGWPHRADRIPRDWFVMNNTGHPNFCVFTQDFQTDPGAISGIGTANSATDIQFEVSKGVGFPCSFYIGRPAFFGQPCSDFFVARAAHLERNVSSRLRWIQRLAVAPINDDVAASPFNFIAPICSTRYLPADSLYVNTAAVIDVVSSAVPVTDLTQTNTPQNHYEVYKWVDSYYNPYEPGLFRTNNSATIYFFIQYDAQIILTNNDCRLIY